MRAILAVPAWEKGRGGGHLCRCLSLVRDLRAMGREAVLFLPAEAGDPGGLFKQESFDPSWRITEDGLGPYSWDCVVLDRFQTPPEEFARWAELAPLAGIDEGGPCRDAFDFLIDILPGLPGASKPNIKDPGLCLARPGTGGNPRKTAGGEEKSRPLRILVSFGQEDAAGLGQASAAALAAVPGGLLEITLLAGALSRKESPPPGVTVLDAIPNLAEHIGEYDLLITHYGLTAFEALLAGTPLVLLSPSAYHEKLAKAAGFFSAGTGKGGAAKLRRLLVKNGKLNRAFLRKLSACRAALALKFKLRSEPGQSLAELISRFSPIAKAACPVCGSGGLLVINRRHDRSFRRCPRCGALSMSRIAPPPLEYDREYFFEFYKKQYGKTYIEDFPNLIRMAKRRLEIIKFLLPAKGAVSGSQEPQALLDIGCAYGPFLAAAGEAGFSPLGIDPSDDAVCYVQKKFGIPAIRGFFPDAALPQNRASFDVISLWYVIEHFQDCLRVFAEIRRILKPGGILAFASPSFSGVSGRFSLGRFLSQSPADHWTIWSPVMCKKALAQAGFRVKKIVVSGHHPERFPLLGVFAKNRASPFYGILLAISKLFRLGDTFEVYAEKLESEE